MKTIQFQKTDSILRKVFALSNQPHLYSNYLQLGPTKTSEKPIMRQNFFFELTYLTLKVLQLHPWAGEDLSLKIDEHDQTIWNCILDL